MEEKDIENKHNTSIKLGVFRENSPYTEEECEEIIKQLEELLDGALPPDEQQKVLNRIENCEYCLEQYKIEKSFRQALKEGFQQFANSKVVQGIKETIRKIRNKTFLF